MDLGSAHGSIVIDYNGAGVKSAMADMDALGSSGAKLASQLSTVGKVLAGIGAGIGIVLGAAVKTAADIEQGLDGVQASTGATDQQMQGLSKTILGLGKDTQFTTNQILETADGMAKAGIGVKDLSEGALEASANLAAATGESLESSGNAIADATNLFHLSGTEAAGTADLITQALNASSIGIGEYSAGFRNLGPIMSSFASDQGEAIDLLGQTGEAVAFFTAQGLKGADAGLSYGRMIENIMNPANKDAAALIQQLGLHVFDMNGEFVGTENLLGQVAEATKGMTNEQREMALQTIFGAEALDAARIAAKSGGDEYGQFIDKMHAGMTAQEAARVRMDNLKGSIEQLSGSFSALLGVIGQPLLAPIRAATDAMTGFVNMLIDAPQGVINFVAAFAGVTAVLATLGGGAALAIAQIIKLNEAFASAGLSLGKFAAGLGIAALAIGALILAYQTNFLGFADFVNSTMARAGKAIDTFGKTFNKTFAGLRAQGVNRVSSALEAIGVALGEISGGEGPINALGAAFTNLGLAIDAGENKFNDMIEHGWNPLSAAIAGVGAGFAQLTGQPVPEFFDNAAKAVQTFGADFAQTNTILQRQGFTPAAAAVQAFGDALKAATGVDITGFADRAAQALNLFGTAFQRATEQGANPLQAALRGAAAALEGLTGIPAVPFVENLLKGFDSLGTTLQEQVLPAIGEFAQKITSGDFAGAVQMISDGLSQALQSAADSISSIDLAQVVVNVASWVGGQIASFAQWVNDNIISGGVDLGSVVANVAGWVIHATQTIADAVKSFMTDGAQTGGISLGTIIATVEGWVIEAAQSIGDAIRAFVGGGSVNSMGGPGERGEASGGVSLGSIVATIAAWVIESAQSVIDAITTFATGQLGGAVAQLGSVAAQVGGWVISAAQSIGDAIQAFVGGGGVNSMGGPGERGEGGTGGVNLGSIVATIQGWIIEAAQSIGDAIQAFVGGSGGNSMGGPGERGEAGTGGVTLSDVTATITSWLIEVSSDIGSAIKTKIDTLKVEVPEFTNWVLNVGAPAAENIVVNAGDILGAIGKAIGDAFSAPTAEDNFKAGLKGQDLGGKLAEWVIGLFKEDTPSGGGQGGPMTNAFTDNATLETVANNFINGFLDSFVSSMATAIDKGIQNRNAELTASVNEAIQNFWDFIGNAINSAFSLAASAANLSGANTMGGPGERGEAGTGIESAIGDFLDGMLDGIVDAIKSKFEEAQGKLEEITSAISEGVQQIMTAISDAINSAFAGGISGFGQFGFQGHGPSAGVSGVGNAIGQFAEQMVTDLYNAFKDIPNQVKSKLGSIDFTGMFDSLKQNLQKAVEMVTGSGLWQFLFPPNSALASDGKSGGAGDQVDAAKIGENFAEQMASVFSSSEFQTALSKGLTDIPQSAFIGVGKAFMSKITEGVTAAMAQQPSDMGLGDGIGAQGPASFAQNIIARMATSLAAAIPSVPATTFQQVGSQLMQKISEGINTALSAGAGGAGGQIAGSGDMAGAGAGIGASIVTSLANSLAVAVTSAPAESFQAVGQQLMLKISDGINTALSGGGQGGGQLAGSGDIAGNGAGIGASIVTSLATSLATSISGAPAESFASVGQAISQKLNEVMQTAMSGGGGNSMGGPGERGEAGGNIGASIAQAITASVQSADFGAVGTAIMQAIGQGIGAAASTVIQALQAVMNAAVQAAQAIAASAQAIGTAIDTAVGQGIGAGAGTVTAAATAMVTTAISAGTSAAAGAQAVGTAFDTAVGQGIGAGAGTITAAATAAVQAAVAAAEAAAGAAQAAGVAFGQGFADGISSMLGAAASAAAALGAAAVEALNGAIAAASPSRETRQSGQWFGQGYSLGIGDEAGAAGDSARKLADSSIEALNARLKSAEAVRQSWMRRADDLVGQANQRAADLERQFGIEVTTVIDDKDMGRYVVGKSIAPLAAAAGRVGKRSGRYA